MTSLNEPQHIKYMPGRPDIDLSSLPSSAVDASPHHLYEPHQCIIESFQPYLVWAEDREDVAHRIGLRNYISPENVADIIHDAYKTSNIKSPTDGVKQNSQMHDEEGCQAKVDKVHFTLDRNKTQTSYEAEKQQSTVWGVRRYCHRKMFNCCIYCHRRVFNCMLRCQCGAVYDEEPCEHKHWPQHKPMCKPDNDIQRTNSGANSDDCNSDEDKDVFDKICQGFKNFHASYGSILDDKDFTKGEINIIPILWWEPNSGLVALSNRGLQTSLLEIFYFMKKLPDADHSQVKIGQLVGVILDHLKLYVRGIVAVKTRLGLIGVLLLDGGSFVFVPSVKVLLDVTPGSNPAWNVQWVVIRQERNHLMQMKLSPYLPSPEQIPLLCITVENETRVILTTFYSKRALYIQPVDLDTQIRCIKISDKVNKWCISNHIPAQWAPKKNQVVGVKRPDGEYRRGQVIGTVTSKKVCSESMEKKHYLVSLMDSGINVTVSCDNLVALPNQFKKDPCYCTKVSLEDSNRRPLNPECYEYLNMLVETKTHLIVNFKELKSMTVDIREDNGYNIQEHIEYLTELPWHTSLPVNPDPTMTEAVLTLHTIKVPPYPLSSGDKVQLKIIDVYNKSYASMLVMIREENEHVQNVLGPSMMQYCDQLITEKYNPRRGSHCLVYCRDLSIWCRAHCEQPSHEFGYCFVFLLDYGVRAHIPTTDIRPCYELFTKFHMMAFVAHIPEWEKSDLSAMELMEKYQSHEFTITHVVNCEHQKTMDTVVLAT